MATNTTTYPGTWACLVNQCDEWGYQSDEIAMLSFYVSGEPVTIPDLIVTEDKGVFIVHQYDEDGTGVAEYVGTLDVSHIRDEQDRLDALALWLFDMAMCPTVRVAF